MDNTRDWCERQDQPLLGLGGTDVWLADINESTESLDALLSMLSDWERRHADQFIFESDARRFAISHLLLRKLLGNYVPGDLQIAQASAGCFVIEGHPSFRVRMSCSGERIVCAISRGRALGVDIQQIRSTDSLSLLARSFLTPGDCHAIQNLPGENQAEALYTCWSRKEALYGALGERLARTDVDIPVLLNGSPCLVLRPSHPGSEWTLLNLPRINGYAAAVAVEGRVDAVSTWKAPQSQFRLPL